jgi:hypothetical protein
LYGWSALSSSSEISLNGKVICEFIVVLFFTVQYFGKKSSILFFFAVFSKNLKKIKKRLTKRS